ncbi:MAG: hypothetical protein KY456_04005 [Chloroflexi bacterium]|nr:hypothetical protein [Chloroflexota bacterium]
MAQTPQAEETGGAGETTPPVTDRPQGFFGGSTTILLLIFAVAFFWWSRRRRAAMEERLQAQRREAEATAERSARDVAHVMRQAASPAAAAAAANEGLASAARMPEAPSVNQDATTARARDTMRTDSEEMGNGAEIADISVQDEARALELERAEAAAAAERAAQEQAERAARDAQLAGESATRRMAAAEASAEEARADTADAVGAGPTGGEGVSANQERDAAEVLREAMRELDDEREVPLGAIAGDGTAICPPGFPVKGNAQSRIYHEPGQVSYSPTVAEFCFASAEAAEAAGFRQSRARGLRPQE